MTGLDGMRALITGGGSGIGLATARRLDAMGVAVTLVGRDRSRLDRALRELAGDRRHDAIACDVGDSAAVAATFRTLAGEGRSPQILVNNAGTTTSAKLADTSDAAWNEHHRQVLRLARKPGGHRALRVKALR